MPSIFRTAIVLLLCGFSVSCTKKESATTAPVKKSVLRAALRQKVRSLDPAYASDFFSMSMVSRSYEGLYQYNYVARPYVLEPALAQGMPTVSADGLLYKIKIKSGVFFTPDGCLMLHSGKSGRELTAEDFIYSWQRILDPKVASPGRWTLEGRVDQLKALSRYELEIRLREPYPQILNILAMPYLFAVAKECVEHYGEDFAMRPVGTGPFKLKGYNSKRFEWEKNPDYREVYYPAQAGGPDVGRRLPLIDEIIDDVIEEDQPAWLAFMKQEHDYLARVPAAQLSQGKLSEPLTYEPTFLKEPAADFTYYAFNMEDPVVGGDGAAQKHLRYAMSYAFDAGPAIERFFLGMAERAQFLIVPGLPEYDSKSKSPYENTFLAKAAEHLVKAGYPRAEGLPEIVLEAPSDPSNRMQAEWFARCMEKIGIKIKLSLSPWAEMLARVRKRQGHIYAVSWMYDYPDVENALQILESSRAVPGPNKSNYSSAQFDKLYAKFSHLKPGPQRTKLVYAMRQIFFDDAPWIMGVHRYETRLVYPWVKNYRVHLFDFGIERYLRVDDREKSGGVL